MADTTKYAPIGTTTGNNLHKLDFKNLFTIFKTKTTIAFAYAFMLVFIAFTLFLAFSPSPTISTTPSSSISQFSSIFSYFFPNTTLSQSQNTTNLLNPFDLVQNNTSISRSTNVTTFSQPLNLTSQDDAVSVSVSVPTINNTIINNSTSQIVKKEDSSSGVKNHTSNFDETTKAVNSNHTTNATTSQIVKKEDSFSGVKNQTSSNSDEAKTKANQTTNATVEGVSNLPDQNLSSNSSLKGVDLNNYTQSLARKKSNKYAELMESLMNCDFFDGEWVKDDSYPLYKPGSCSSIIDEQFNCIRNGRPDKDYQKYKWKPKGCTLPRYSIQFNSI
jgi:hypothetical protein